LAGDPLHQPRGDPETEVLGALPGVVHAAVHVPRSQGTELVVQTPRDLLQVGRGISLEHPRSRLSPAGRTVTTIHFTASHRGVKPRPVSRCPGFAARRGAPRTGSDRGGSAGR